MSEAWKKEGISQAKLARALGVSLDYLVGNTDREHILFAIEAMLRDAKARMAYAS